MPGPTYVPGDRIDLRTVEEEDLDFFHETTNHPEVRRYIGLFDGPYGREEYEEELFEMLRSGVSFVVCVGDERVGNVSLAPIKEGIGWANLGAWLHPDYHGEGYALESCAYLLEHGFGERGLRRVTASYMAPNDGSARLVERLGFVHEGTLREHARCDGEFVDEERYGLLREEWDGVEAVLG